MKRCQEESTGVLHSITQPPKMKINFHRFAMMEHSHTLHMAEKLDLTVGPDIFRDILSYLSDFDLVHFEGPLGGPIISKYATEVLNKRVGDDTAHSIIMRHYGIINHYNFL